MPERVAKTDAFTAITEAVGSGPFRFVKEEWVPGNKVVYVKNADYVPRKEAPSWGAGGKVAKVDRVEWIYIPDAATAAAALNTGEVDWWQQLPPDLIPLLAKNKDVKIENTDPLGSIGLMRFNHVQPPFNNQKLRQAVLVALDQNDYAIAIAGDAKNGKPCPSYFTCGTPLANTAGSEILTGKRDIEKAKALVKESGYKGEKVIVLDATDQPIVHAQALVTADLFRKIGINAELAASDWGTVITRRASKEPVEKGGWSILHTWFVGPDIVNPALNSPLRGAGEKSWFGWPTDREARGTARRVVRGAHRRRAEEDRRGPAAAGVGERAVHPDRAVHHPDRVPQQHLRHHQVAGDLPVERGEEVIRRACRSAGRLMEIRDRVLSYALRRLAATIPVMGVVALFVFSLLYLSPGDPAAMIAGDIATEEDIARIRAKLGLDEPYFVRFGTWLWALAHGDLGTSIFTGLPVTTLIGQRVEPTLALTLCTLVVAVALAVPLGVVAAARAGSWIDRVVMAISVLGFSVPVFVLAYGLVLVFAVGLEWLPVQGYASFTKGLWPFVQHMILPSVALGITYMALIARITRASMLDVLAQDYVRTAHAKGLAPSTVLHPARAEERRGADRHHHRHRHRAADRRRGRHRDGVRDPRHRPPHRRRDPAPRLPDHPGRHAAVLGGVRARQPGGRPLVHAVRSAHPLLNSEPMAATSAIDRPSADVAPPRPRCSAGSPARCAGTRRRSPAASCCC